VVFDYYRRLSAKDRRTYRRSDEIVELRLPSPADLHGVVGEIAQALALGDRRAVGRAAQALCLAATRQLRCPPVRVSVLVKRPKRADGELHGLYTLDEEGVALIEVWMKTAEQRRVVAFRTFLRTLLHELCHHLDLTHLGLEETFHTEGFFRRESSLFRQLAPKRAAPRARESSLPERRAVRKPAQLSLFEA